MLPRSVEKQGLTQLVSVRPSVPKVPRSILRFYLKSFIGPSWYLPWVPEVWVAKRRENDRQPAIQHFGLYAFAAGEREDLWHSGVSLARLESVSFVEKVGTKAKKMGGGKRRKGILFSPPPSSIFCSHSYFRAVTRVETSATQWFLRGTAWDEHFASAVRTFFFAVVCSHCWWRWTRCQSKYCARSRRSKPDVRVTRTM